MNRIQYYRYCGPVVLSGLSTVGATLCFWQPFPKHVHPQPPIRIHHHGVHRALRNVHGLVLIPIYLLIVLLVHICAEICYSFKVKQYLLDCKCGRKNMFMALPVSLHVYQYILFAQSSHLTYSKSRGMLRYIYFFVCF